uniref:Uncharacterized protein n=2 Tax=Ditylum brightwellii TaxID=49249 RepID=A0A7S4VCW6_9STRA
MSCAFYTDVWKSLDFHMIQTLHKDNPCQYLVPFKPPQKDTSEKKRGHRAMWKKQETVIHERIVKYITVEPDGTVHELVETDKNQSEVRLYSLNEMSKQTWDRTVARWFNSHLGRAGGPMRSYATL